MAVATLGGRGGMGWWGVCADASAVTVMGVMDMIMVVLGVTAIV